MDNYKFDKQDISRLIGDWGSLNSKYDLNGDGVVDGQDLSILFSLIEENEEVSPKPEVEVNDLVLYPHHGVLSSRYFTGPRNQIINMLREEEPMDAFARFRSGAKPYYLWYQSWDSLAAAGQPGGKKGSLAINVNQIIEDVREYFGDQEPEGYGQLDYEGDFFRALDEGENTKGNNEATEVMLDALCRVKEEFPKMKWTYYGLPSLKYWLPHPSPTTSYTWLDAPEEVKQAEIEHRYSSYAKLLAECDWLNPSFYNKYDPDVVKGDIVPRESMYRFELVKLCHLINQRLGTNKPIIPMTCPWYTPGGHVEYEQKIVQEQFMRDSVLLPYLKAGVSGFAIWYATSYYAGRAFSMDPGNRSMSLYNSFLRNYNLSEEDFDLKNMDVKANRLYKDTFMDKTSKTILKHMKVMRHFMDKFHRTIPSEYID